MMDIKGLKDHPQFLVYLGEMGFGEEQVFSGDHDREIGGILEDFTKFALTDGYYGEDALPQRIHDIYKSRGYSVYNDAKKRFLESIGYEHIEQVGGGEGDGEYVHGIFKLGDKFYRAEWNYYSYHGFGGAWEYDEMFETLYEVTPTEKTIIVYE